MLLVPVKIDCGAPEDVVGASKSYSTTIYKSEVIYVCKDGKELKATCKENKKWSPVVSCKGNVNRFSLFHSVLVILFQL